MAQEIGVFALVAGAAIYLARMVWLQSRGKGCDCGKSTGCSSKTVTSSTRNGEQSAPQTLPPHLIQLTTQITTRDKANLN